MKVIIIQPLQRVTIARSNNSLPDELRNRGRHCKRRQMRKGLFIVTLSLMHILGLGSQLFKEVSCLLLDSFKVAAFVSNTAATEV